MALDSDRVGSTGPAGLVDMVDRPMVEDDFDRCLDLLRDGMAYPRPVLSELTRFWERLLADDALVTTVVEAKGELGPPQVVGFGASVFVTEEWMQHQQRGDEPHLTARTVRAELSESTPILRPAEVAQADGVHVLILHYGEARGLDPALLLPLRYRMFESLVSNHRGYRVMSVLQEFWDEIDRQFVTNGWGRVISDYSSYLERRGDPPPEGRSPLLIGVTREEVEANPGSLAAPLFLHLPPQIGFTAAEQRLLRLALAGHTDLEMAQTLGLSMATVKSQWRSIYYRVARHAPTLMADVPSIQPSNTRGKEKRRRLLDYIRRHPEELRPGPASRR